MVNYIMVNYIIVIFQLYAKISQVSQLYVSVPYIHRFKTDKTIPYFRYTCISSGMNLVENFVG